MRNWTAQHVFDFRFLKTLYQQLPQAQRSQGCQLIATNSGFASLGDVFNGSHTPTTEPWHIGWYVLDESKVKLLFLISTAYIIALIIYSYITLSNLHNYYGDMNTGHRECQVYICLYVIRVGKFLPMGPAGLFASQRTGNHSAGISSITHELFYP
jgi:hypothetical protein